jgi:hypothetical protein
MTPFGASPHRRNPVLIQPISDRLQGHALSSHVSDPLAEGGIVDDRRPSG